MEAVACFWLVLCLPGYAFLRRFFPDALDGGAPSTVALSYLASLALLCPISVVGYVLHLPLFVLSGSILLSVLGAAIWLARHSRFPQRWPTPSLIAILVGLLIAGDAIVGLHAGSYITTGDGPFHVARVRMLVTYGFNSWDPLMASRRFDPIYHTNIYHALMGAAAQLTRRSAPEVWIYTLFWAKLVSAASIYHLARVALDKRWLAWIAAGMFTVWTAPNPLVTVPHNVSVYFLLGLGLAFALELMQGQPRLRSMLGLAACAALLPQFHGLVYVFLCFSVAPVLLGRLALAQLRERPERRALLFAVFALGLGAPWFAAHAWERVHPPVVVSQQNAPMPRDEGLMYRGFIELPGGLRMFDPAPLKDWNNETTQLLVALVAGLFTRRRRSFLVLAAFSAGVLALLYVPPLCTWAIAAASRGWIIGRFSAVLGCLHLALFPGALLLLLAEWLAKLAPNISAIARTVTASALRLAALAATLFYAQTIESHPWTWAAYLSNAKEGRRTYEVAQLAKTAALFQRSVPVGAVLAAEPGYWHVLGMVCDCYPLALNANLGDYLMPDMPQRREALAHLIYLEANLADRVRWARRYGVRHIFVHHTGSRFGQRLLAVTAPITAKVVTESGSSVIEIDPERFDPKTAAQ
jgi:hypothetical protein